MGLLSSAKSSANTSTSTQTTDKRIVADGASQVESIDRSNIATGNAINLATRSDGKNSSTRVSITQTDYGAVDAALKFAGETVDAVAGDGLSRLLDLAGDMFERQDASTQAAMSAVSAAYSRAEADKSGGFDQRTVLMLAAVAGVVLVVYFSKGR